jgi:hypothetical protein
MMRLEVLRKEVIASADRLREPVRERGPLP